MLRSSYWNFPFLFLKRNTIEQSDRLLRIDEDGPPLTEAQIGCDDDARAFIELAEQVKEECTA